MRSSKANLWWRARALLVVMLTCALVPVTGAGAAAAPVRAGNGATVVEQTWVGERMLDLTIQSPSLGRTASVRLLVPDGWEQGAGQSWPTLWLLHGCCDAAEYKSWTAYTDVEQFTADKPVLVVMPSGGKIGMYSDWWNYGLPLPPDWESFHMSEVWQILHRGYGAGRQHAIAGLSMGGYGAMEYSTRYPDRFGAAAAYSAALDVLAPGIPQVTQMNMIAQGFFIWGMLWGNPWSNRDRWRAHNPTDKVDKLRGMELYVSAGNGELGPLDGPDTPAIAGALLEGLALENSKRFTAELERAGIPVTTDYYGPGTHTWPYWERSLHRSWPTLANGMGLS